MRPFRSSPLPFAIALTAVPIVAGFASEQLSIIILLLEAPLWVALLSGIVEPLVGSAEGRVAQVLVAGGGITFLALSALLFGSDHVWLGLGCAGVGLVPLASLLVVHLDRR
jgi:hypothetical protein